MTNDAMLPANTWPWMPVPSGPKRSGTLKRPAARDDRGGEQKRESCCFLVGEASQ